VKPSPGKNRFTWIFILVFINLLLIYLYFYYVLLNYDLTWVEFEKLKTHIWILENGKHWYCSDFAKALNTKIIEIDPNRLSRPLSNLLEVIDAKFRANCWDHIPPHPILSLQWPFLFIGLPLLLYKFFRNMDCHPVIALAGAGLYLTSPGFLSPIVELSHPAKSMVNFFGILSLVMITQIGRLGKINWLMMITCLSSALIAFFSDETGLFFLLVLGVFFYPLFLKFKQKAAVLACFLVLPVFYFIIIHFFLPWLHYIVLQKTADLGAYRDFPRLSKLFLPDLHDLLTNFYLLFSVHPGLKWDFKPLASHPFLISLQALYTAAFLSLMAAFIYLLFKQGKFSLRVRQISAAFGLLIIFVFFHNFQLSHNVRVWTIFWYGCLFSLIYYVTLTLVLQLVWEQFKGNAFKVFLPLLIFIFTAHGLMTSTYLTRIFKDQRYNPGVFYYPSIFNGTINMYQYFDLSKSLQSSRCRHAYEVLYWAGLKHIKIDPHTFSKEAQDCPSFLVKDPWFQTDLAYITIEAGFQWPWGRSYLNDPVYVASWMRQTGESP